MVMDPRDFYARCNLTNNPFRPNPTNESDPRMDVWVGYQKELFNDNYLFRATTIKIPGRRQLFFPSNDN